MCGPKHSGIVTLGFTVNSGQPKQGVAESLAAAGFAQAPLRDRDKAVMHSAPNRRSTKNRRSGGTITTR
jgi:hypothetical protein